MPLIDDLERQVRERLKELEPLVNEAAQLRAVLSNFERGRDTPGRRRGTGEPGTRRRGRPPGSATGGRAELALRLVAERPGVTVAELAEEMGIGTTYLYRVMPALEREGKVRKNGTGYEPAT